MKEWLESVYSDGTGEFVSSPAPKLFETVTVKLRLYEDAPVRHVFLRSLHNGAECLEEARTVKTERGLRYFEAPLKITESGRYESVRIPFGVIGASGPKEDQDIFGERLACSCIDEVSATLTVKANQSYFFECKMKDL